MSSDDPPLSPEASDRPNPPRRRRLLIWVAVALAGVLLLVFAVPWAVDRFSPKPIRLTLMPDAPRGGYYPEEQVWVKAEAVGELPAEAMDDGRYTVLVFLDGEPVYGRKIEPTWIESGKLFDFSLFKKGQDFTAAFYDVEGQEPSRRLSNTISFRH